jgi:hypothetical protein
MARIEVTEESLRTGVDERVFAQAMTWSDKVSEVWAAGFAVEAVVDGSAISVRIRPDGLDARCECPAPMPCAHAVAAVLAWVRAAEDNEDLDPVADLFADFDDVLSELADEARACGPGDEWYPDTDDLEDLLDEVEELAGQAPDGLRELTARVIGRLKDILGSGHDQGDDLAEALARVEELAAALSRA